MFLYELRSLDSLGQKQACIRKVLLESNTIYSKVAGLLTSQVQQKYY